MRSAGICVLCAFVGALFSAEPNPDFNYFVTLVRPVLLQRCGSCHKFENYDAALRAVRQMPPDKRHAKVYRPLDSQVVKAWLDGAKMEKAVENAPAFDEFVEKIQPILARPGSDGYACVNCHALHAVLHLVPPDEDRPYTFDQLKSNYEAALRVVDLATPENSFILRKPASPKESASGLTHTGGIRWPKGRDSEQYRALLHWVSRQ